MLITIWDNDAPEISIGDASATQITETSGAEVRFPLTTLVSPNDSIDIYYTLTESTEVGDGDFINANDESSDPTNPKSKSIDFSGSKTTADFVIPIAPDDLAEGSSTITLTLVAQPGTLAEAKYSLASTVSAKTLTIEDDDSTPVLRVADILAPVNEDIDADDNTNPNEVVFVVTAPIATELTVYYQASEVGSGNFLESTEETRKSKSMNFAQVGGTGPFIDTISVPIHDDSNGEATGQIKLTLLAESGDGTPTYRVESNGTEDAYVTIFDDDVPELTIVAAEVNETEGPLTKADFTVEAYFSPNSMLTVNFKPTDVGDFIGGSFTDNTSTTAELDFREGKTSASLAIDIASESDTETNGSITVTLEDESTLGTSYTVGASPENAATVNIIDDDSLSLLTISAPTTPIAESEGIVDFIITTTTDLGSDFEVRYDPSEVSTGNFLNDNATPTSQEAVTTQAIDFTGSNNSYTATLSVPIHNDEIGERTGQIEVSLLRNDVPIELYKVATDGTQAVTATIIDDDAPELKISAGDPVIEGFDRTADFTITSVMPVSALTLNYTPTSVNFIQAGSGVPTSTTSPIIFRGIGPYTATLPITVHDDEASENNGTIQVTLNEESTPATTYTIAPSPNNSASTSIMDDDSIPQLTISAPTTPVLESTGKVDYVLTTTINPGTNFRVRYKASEVFGGDFLDAGPTPTNQEAITTQNVDFSGSAGTYTAILTAPIHNDAVSEHTGQIEVALIADDAKVPTYRIAPDNGPATRRATIWDDEVPELAISANGALTEGDGNFAEFTITSQLPVPNDTLNDLLYPNKSEFLTNRIRCANFREVCLHRCRSIYRTISINNT